MEIQGTINEENPGKNMNRRVREVEFIAQQFGFLW